MNPNQALNELEQEIVRFFVEKPEFSKQYVTAIEPEDFQFDHTREIFEAVVARSDKGEMYDKTLILSDVSETRECVSTLRYSTGIDEDDIGLYITRLRDLSSKREIQDYLSEGQIRIKKKVSAYEFASRSIDFFKDVLDGTAVGNNVAQTLVDYVDEHKKQVDEIRAGKALGITTGMDLLDDYMAGGLKNGDLILIGARPSVGKTALALTIAYNAAKAGANVLFFSVEMKMKDIYDRLLAFESGATLTDIIRGTVDLTKHYESLSKLNFRIVESPSCTSKDVVTTSTREKYVKGADLIVVDYLQYLKDSAKGQSDAVRVGRISRNLKGLAGTLNVPVIAPVQLNRKSEYRTGENRGVPSLEDLRDSGNLEQDADVVMLMNRHEDPAKATLRIAKNRKGTTGKFVLNFNMKTTRFTLDYNDQKMDDIDKELGIEPRT